MPRRRQPEPPIYAFRVRILGGYDAPGGATEVWREIEAGAEWIVDADLKDFFGTVSHEKLLALVAQRVSDGRVLRLIEAALTAGSYGEGRLFPTEQGTPQGGVASPLYSNILLTPFDQEMRRRGYQLTRYADDWVITCRSEAEAQTALAAASRVLEALGVVINPQKTRIVVSGRAATPCPLGAETCDLARIAEGEGDVGGGRPRGSFYDQS
jgi:retron-type reverse transcriptase